MCLRSDLRKVSRIHDQCEGNRANPEKEAQRLTGRITALTRFISRAGDWSLPFFKAIKRQKSLSGPYEQSFHFPQLLARPVAGDVLQLYLAISESTLSSVLIREEAKVERSVYYISIVLRVGEARYPQMEKLVYANIVAARKLKPYFEAYPVEVVTDQPLRKILENPSRSSQIVKW
ncbi:hypothetical protein LIER_15691 [Lithospermum erythrorhizon]|uniref:Reverse transcriptase RNase H-like domain-containing protein n=1 Tax=Lithospermum erythrorhizon TaxID=34254 RepID=A0AAV3Q5G0_LITER